MERRPRRILRGGRGAVRERARPRPRPRGGVPGPRPRDARAHRRLRGAARLGAGDACASASPASCSRSEIEVSTPRTLHFGQAAKQLLLNRAELFAHADAQGYALGSTGTHPFSGWKDQQIIDTPHYRLVEDRLKYVAWRNNTWAAHVHVGVRGCDQRGGGLRRAAHVPAAPARAVGQLAVHRGRLDAAALGAHADVRAHVPALRHPGRVRHVGGAPRLLRGARRHQLHPGVHADLVVGAAAPPLRHRGGPHLRRADRGLAEPGDLVAHRRVSSPTSARVYDEGMPLPILETRYIEENLWRAIRYGLDGKLVDWAMGEELHGDRRGAAPGRARGAARPDAIGLSPHLADVERMLRDGNGAQQQARAHVEGESSARGLRRHGRRRPRAALFGQTADVQGEQAMSDDAEQRAEWSPTRSAPAALLRAAEERARLRPGLRHDRRGLVNFGYPKMGLYRRDARGARPRRRAAVHRAHARRSSRSLEREQGEERTTRPARHAGADAARLRARRAAGGTARRRPGQAEAAGGAEEVVRARSRRPPRRPAARKPAAKKPPAKKPAAKKPAAKKTGRPKKTGGEEAARREEAAAGGVSATRSAAARRQALGSAQKRGIRRARRRARR